MSLSGWRSHTTNQITGIATIVAVFGGDRCELWLNRLFSPAGKAIASLANITYSDVLFTPANYAFAIWGVIYCGLIGFSFYQLSWYGKAALCLRPACKRLADCGACSRVSGYIPFCNSHWSYQPYSWWHCY